MEKSNGYMEMYDYNRNRREQMPYMASYFVDAKRLTLLTLVDAGCRKILDYGCGHGTFKCLGNVTTKMIKDRGYGATLDQPGTINIFSPEIPNDIGLLIDGFDDDIANIEAKYHSHDDVKEHYDAIIASHVIEHMEIEEAEAFIKWAAKVADNLVITQPHTYDLFEWHHFYTGIDHKRPYDNANMYYWLEQAGWDITGVWRTDLKFPHWKWRILLYRMYHSYMAGISPFRMHTTICRRKQK